jgi:hypothetical protein
VLSFYTLSAEVLSPRRGVPPDRAFTAAGLVGRSVGITTQPDHEVLTLHDTVATLTHLSGDEAIYSEPGRPARRVFLPSV